MKAINRITGLSFLPFLLIFAGCGPVLNPYNEDFKCRAKDDSGECIDTPKAYEKARFPEPVLDEKAKPLQSAQKELQDSRYRFVAELLQVEPKPLLEPPKVLRVLLLPYKGEDGELFMSRYAYLKIEDSKWILTDLKEQ